MKQLIYFKQIFKNMVSIMKEGTNVIFQFSDKYI